MTIDLFSYPHAPGHRHIDTSIEAANKISPAAKTIRDKFYALIMAAGENGMTTEELCRASKVTDRAGQPRTSELRSMGKIVDSKMRRKGTSGVGTIVWVIA